MNKFPIWSGQRWMRHEYSEAAARQALLRCALWVASFPPDRSSVRLSPRIVPDREFESRRDRYLICARMNVAVV